MPRPNRTVEQLRAASEHLHYEVSMFDATGRALGSGLFGPGAATNAFLESFTIHTRALLQFLFPKDPKPDDVVAEDYFDNPKIWLDLRGNMPEALGVVNQRVGKEIAHLTYARLDVTPETKGWNIPVIWAAVLRLVQAFAKNVPQDRLGPSWQSPDSKSESNIGLQPTTARRIMRPSRLMRPPLARQRTHDHDSTRHVAPGSGRGSLGESR